MPRSVRLLPATIMAALALVATACATLPQVPADTTPAKHLEIIASGKGRVTVTVQPNPLDIPGSSAAVEIYVHETEKGLLPLIVRLTLLDANKQPTGTYVSVRARENPETGLAEKREVHDLQLGEYQVWGEGLLITPVILQVV